MPDPGPLPAPALNERREETVKALIEHFAQDRLTLEQLEQRLDIANRARTAADLEALTADLPAPARPSPAAAPAPGVRRQADADAVRQRQVLVAVMGGVERKGAWTPARRTLVMAVMGGAVLDLREAAFAPGETEFQVFCFWGGVEIIAPPDVRIDADGLALMAGFEHGPSGLPDPPADAPTVRVTGVAIMGGVEIYTRLPGESAKDARRRLKAKHRSLPRRPGE
jgi:hypothetical protein